MAIDGHRSLLQKRLLRYGVLAFILSKRPCLVTKHNLLVAGRLGYGRIFIDKIPAPTTPTLYIVRMLNEDTSKKWNANLQSLRLEMGNLRQLIEHGLMDFTEVYQHIHDIFARVSISLSDRSIEAEGEPSQGLKKMETEKIWGANQRTTNSRILRTPNRQRSGKRPSDTPRPGPLFSSYVARESAKGSKGAQRRLEYRRLSIKSFITDNCSTVREQSDRELICLRGLCPNNISVPKALRILSRVRIPAAGRGRLAQAFLTRNVPNIAASYFISNSPDLTDLSWAFLVTD
ncbi:hypothetical protein PHISCL_00946 [Aspergillus sclerotialis]|uniref:Uncharacterized protein n=1 Tax=Aspergillus sclerotialis TaxID=2070753 RepID=A0A3A3A9P6_9EURO|nr:hypothetical protein PHISCL_00946 [Aspergillus sclerotialis]